MFFWDFKNIFYDFQSLATFFKKLSILKNKTTKKIIQQTFMPF
jgi:hypothetical protein